ncbi:MAG: OmpA family protein, partial [Elusimicrobiota bacterium]|nr:OmpA family protein [Elusimicrobiota bacterium]
MTADLQGYVQDEFLFVFERGQARYLPFYQFALITGLAITKNDGAQLSGFASERGNTFLIDFPLARASFNKKQIPLDAGAAVQVDGQLAFSVEFLENLFNLTININDLNMLVDIEADWKLPNTLLLDARQKRAASGGDYVSPRDLWADYEFDGRQWALPVVDLRFGANMNSRGPQDGAARQTSYSESYGVNIAALAAGLDANLYLFGTSYNDFDPSLRFKVGRTFLRDKYKFPNLTTFEAGDITGTGSSFFTPGGSGRGVSLTSFKNYVVSADKLISISGALQDGWDVELYLNDQLLGFRQPSVMGRFEFDNVPVNYGLNVFKLVFYGPYGEIRTEERRYYSGTSPVKKGEFGYSAKAYQPNRYLLERDTDFVSQSSVPVVDLMGFYGVNDYFTAMAGFTGAQDAQDNLKPRRFAMAGGQFLFKGASLQYNLESDVESGSLGHHAEAQGNVYIGDVFARYEHYGDINSPIAYRGGAYLKELFEGRLSGTFSALFNTPYYINYTTETDHFGHGQNSVSVRLSRNFLRFLHLSLEDFWQGASYFQGGATNDAALLLQAGFGRLGIYAGASYRTHPDNYLSEVTARLDYRWDRRTYFSAEYRRGQRYAMSRLGEDTLSLRGSRIFNFGGISADLSFSTHKNISASVTYNISFGPAANAGAFSDAKTRLSDYGSVALSAVDEAGAPVEHVVISVTGAEKVARTDSEGQAVVTDIAPYEKVIVNLDLSEIEDSALFPLSDNYRYILRPGTVRNIALPLARKGALEGLIKHDFDDNYLLGYEIAIYDGQGNILHQTFSDSFGMFILDNLPFGVYAVDISKDGVPVKKVEGVKVDGLANYLEVNVLAPAPRHIQGVSEYEDASYEEHHVPVEAALAARGGVAPAAAPQRPAQNLPPDNFINGLDYAFNSYKLSAAQKERIKQKAQELKNYAYSKVIVTGNTDNIGPRKVNERISMLRAISVREALISCGIPEAVIETRGAADDNPL